MDEILAYVILKNPVKNWLFAAVFAAGGYFAGLLVSWIAAGLLKKISAGTKSRISDVVLPIVRRPLILFIFLFGISLGLEFLVFGEPADLWIGRIFSAAMVLLAAYTTDKLFNAILDEYMPALGNGRSVKSNAELQPILKKVIGSLIWVIAIVMTLNILGYNINAILAGLGLGGAAIALASKDTLANFFGSITVFVDKPFKIHDRIKIAGFEGYITEMGMRTSRLKTPENYTVIIPNSIFASTPIVNISAEPSIRVSQAINISKEIDLDRLEEALGLIKTICGGCPGVEADVECGVVGIGGSSYQVSILFFVSRDLPYLETVNRVNMEILRRFGEAGIKLA